MYDILVPEVRDDPLTRGYAGMEPGQVAADMNNPYRTGNVEMVTGQDIFEAATLTDYGVLTAVKRDLFHAIIGMGEIRVNGTNTKAALLNMFGPGTTTRANLAALQVRAISRAEELGLPELSSGHVESARQLI